MGRFSARWSTTSGWSRRWKSSGVPTVDASWTRRRAARSSSRPTVCRRRFTSGPSSQRPEDLDTTCPFVYDIHDEADAGPRRRGHIWSSSASRRPPRGGRLHPRSRSPRPIHVLTTVEEASKRSTGVAYPSVSRSSIRRRLNAEEYEDVARYIETQVRREAERADTVCYATKENQDAARASLGDDPEIDLILVIGGRWSANTRHLWEICSAELKPSAYLFTATDGSARPSGSRAWRRSASRLAPRRPTT